MSNHPVLNYTADGVAAGTVVMALVGILPGVAALLAAIWYLVQIYESKTVQDWLAKRAIRRRAIRLQKLEAKKLILAAEIDAIERVRVAKVYGAEKVEEAKSDAARGVQLQNLAAKIPD